MAVQRLKKEYKDFSLNGSPEFTAGPVREEDMYDWQAVMKGPDGTPYENGIFFLNLKYPMDYPFKPPKISFTTRVYHPNIKSNGELGYIKLYKDGWSPSFTIQKVLQEIFEMMKNPRFDTDDRMPLTEPAKQYKYDRSGFNAKAKAWTEEHAM